jgi:hypothetical protein
LALFGLHCSYTIKGITQIFNTILYTRKGLWQT